MLDSLLKWLFEKRYKRLISSAFSFESTQEYVLGQIIKNNVNCSYLKDLSIHDIASFKAFCPLIEYDQIEDKILNIKNGITNTLLCDEVLAFSKSSGTTSTSKYIPYSRVSLENNFKGGKDMLALYLHSFPESKILSGKNFSLTGSYMIENGFVVGDVSSLFAYFLKPWYKPFRVPNVSIATISDWEEKLQKLSPILSKADIRWIAGVPSWIKVVIDSLEKSSQKPINEIWPNLEVFFYGGISIEPFRPYFTQKFNDRLTFWQTYNASEGFYGLQLYKNENDILLLPNNGIYYEFIAKNEIEFAEPRILSSNELIIHQQYELIITNHSGLYRYRTGDMIIVTSLSPLKIRISGRTKSYINMFGEELMVNNTEEAISYINHRFNLTITDYTVAPIMEEIEGGYHRWLIESEIDNLDLEELELELDTKLQMLNSDYRAKREKNLVLKNLKITKLPHGTFYCWLKENKRLNIQSKIPKLLNSSEIQEELMSLAE